MKRSVRVLERVYEERIRVSERVRKIGSLMSGRSLNVIGPHLSKLLGFDKRKLEPNKTDKNTVKRRINI